VCTPYCGLAVCVFSSCPSIKARWPSVWVRTYLVVREETEVCCFFSCVRTPWSACVQTVVLTGTGFGKINSESLQIHYTRSCLGRHLTVQHSGIDHNYVNQVAENFKLPFFWVSVRNLPVLRISKSTFWMWLLYTDTTAGHDISTWFFYFLLCHHMCNLGNSPTNIEMRSTLLFVLKYNSRNIHRIKVSGIFLWKTHLASFSNYVQ